MKVFLLTAAASLLLFAGPARRGLMMHSPSLKVRPRPGREVTANDVVLLIRQLSALLRGGRSIAQLWHDAQLVTNSAGLREFLAKAAALSALGLSPTTELNALSRSSRLSRQARKATSEMLICFEIAEHTGAPLALTLETLAAHIEQRMDLEAQRGISMAGPRTTARLLGWLPLLGLGGGFLIGLDPLSVLLTTPWGLAALFGGLSLILLSRLWTAALIQAAAGRSLN
ncbi:type II secretion system F family protein [Psychromicrobium sp. YIM B11713]|uniref:type II secretion system F family protein n=1 Tax=Psychromicrobium sp. YIM B11713 TaxID=3145233 RepID=UPI00374E94B3